MKCPFKKVIAIRSYEHEEKFGLCEYDCPARIVRADNSIGCAFIERYMPIKEVHLNDIGNVAESESRLHEVWRQGSN